MSTTISLALESRTVTGKKVAKLRADGYVPSVVYGGTADPISTQSLVVETTKVAHQAGKHTPVHLTIDGKKNSPSSKTSTLTQLAIPFVTSRFTRSSKTKKSLRKSQST